MIQFIFLSFVKYLLNLPPTKKELQNPWEFPIYIKTHQFAFFPTKPNGVYKELPFVFCPFVGPTFTSHMHLLN